jgi:hypothetical protein
MIGFTISLSAINIQNLKHIFAAQSFTANPFQLNRNYFLYRTCAIVHIPYLIPEGLFINGLSLGFHDGQAVFSSHCVIPRSSIFFVFLHDFFESY